MAELNSLFEKNKQWAERIHKEQPEFFEELSAQQQPAYMWIGCSDSRVPANQIVDLPPGEIFVHRNIANQVIHTDLNVLSVLHYAVAVLKVEHVIVCGHYGCGGIKAALEDQPIGLIDNWLRHIQDVQKKYAHLFDDDRSMDEQARFLCELNVIEQVHHLSRTSIAQEAWSDGQDLKLHGLIYGLEDGIIRDLQSTIDDPEKADAVCERAISKHYLKYST